MVADGEADEGVDGGVAQAAEGAVIQGRLGALTFPDDFSGGVIFAHALLLRHEVVAVG